ncbi:WecB/TagA/CpsF family glycosyltransferase [Aquicoccus sp. SCR17]|nr:WecB/TagA/CpsF family glycosyltransferase [Carideicomes alvinocaridis]
MNEVRGRLRDGAGFALATLNLDHLVKLRGNPAFRKAYAAQNLVVADGNPVVWLSHLAGGRVSLVTGSDMVLPLCVVAAEQGVTVALLGSTQTALDRAAAVLEAQVEGLRIVARIAPPMGFDPEGAEAARLLEDVAASGARLCLLALGAPKQEILAARGREIAPHVGFASIGAGLDFIAGTQRRAPLWIRRLALEWLWRLAVSPARLAPRYARCFAILPSATLAALRHRRDPRNLPPA